MADAKHGKIVVNHDEWTLSDSGFQQSPDAEIFVGNVTKWFTGGRPGKFHAYSNNFGLAQNRLAEAIKKAGHTWTVDVNKKFDLDTLLTFDGVFLSGNPVDNKVLIEYVKAGGNVYLAAGTGVGGAQVEANNWKTFLNAFGLEYAGQYNNLVGNQTINSSHPIFAGVKSLYQAGGNSIFDRDPNSNDNLILVAHPTGGLYAVFAKPETPAEATSGQFEVKSNAVDGIEFTNKQDKEVSYKFSPSGTWLAAKREQGIPETTAEGFKYLPEEYQKDLKYPNNTAFSLVAVNKTTGAIVEVGKETTITVKPGETLVFAVNDFPQHYGDNTGTLTVKWSVS